MRRAIPDAPPPAPPLSVSRFNVPLQYDFTSILGVVEQVVPQTFGSLDSIYTAGDDERKRYAYVATRGPFTAWADGSDVHLQATLSYTARGWYKPPIGPTLSAGCGDGTKRPRIVVELVTPLTLTSTWHLKSAAILARMTPASPDDRDRCTVTLIHYDVTDRVLDAARNALLNHLPAIDRKIAEVDLTNRFAEWWQLLDHPIHLADSVWLLLQPQQLRLGRVTGTHSVLTIQAGLDAYPKIVTGILPSHTTPPLPPLAHDTGSKGFQILLEGVVDYATASRALTTALTGTRINEAGHIVQVESVEITPMARGRLSLIVTFAGDANGTLQFVGTPHYDVKLGEMTVPDLDYDLETDSQLIAAYAWLRSDALRTLFRDKAQISVALVLDRAKMLLVQGLNRKLGHAVTLSAQVDSVDVQGVYVTRAGLLVRARAMGTAGMAVRQP